MPIAAACHRNLMPCHLSYGRIPSAELKALLTCRDLPVPSASKSGIIVEMEDTDKGLTFRGIFTLRLEVWAPNMGPYTF